MVTLRGGLLLQSNFLVDSPLELPISPSPFSPYPLEQKLENYARKNIFFSLANVILSPMELCPAGREKGKQTIKVMG